MWSVTAVSLLYTTLAVGLVFCHGHDLDCTDLELGVLWRAKHLAGTLLRRIQQSASPVRTA